MFTSDLDSKFSNLHDVLLFTSGCGRGSGYRWGLLYRSIDIISKVMMLSLSKRLYIMSMKYVLAGNPLFTSQGHFTGYFDEAC